MRDLCLYSICIFLALAGHAQGTYKDAQGLSKPKIESLRKFDIYHNRKISYAVSETVYGFTKDCAIYHATDVLLSVRQKWANTGDVLSFEFTGGASLEPYQGYRLHLGFDYEVVIPIKLHPYFGCQFAEGLRQNTNPPNDSSSVIVGSHSYIVPFVGVMIWPGKRDPKKFKNTDTDEAKYFNPTFWQLVFIKVQAGYSILISKLEVDPSETFPPLTTGHIIQNTGTCLHLSLGVGINLPTFRRVRLITPNFQAN